MTAAVAAVDAADDVERVRHPRHGRLWEAVRALVPDGELAHDHDHLLRVYRWALALAPEAGADADCCGAAALVHDLALVPKDAPDRAAGGTRSASLAVALLAEAGYAPGEVAAIGEAVRTSSWSRGLPAANPLGVVLQDADRLDAIGALGILRLVACAQWMSRPGRVGRFYHGADPFAEHGRALDERRYALDHCATKLLRLAEGMHLPSARAEAALRHAQLQAFLAAIRRELASAARSPAIDRPAPG